LIWICLFFYFDVFFFAGAASTFAISGDAGGISGTRVSLHPLFLISE
jgi:hypothetical protein